MKNMDDGIGKKSTESKNGGGGARATFQKAFFAPNGGGIFGGVANYSKVARQSSGGVDEEEAADKAEGKMLFMVVAVMCLIASLAILDELTMKFARQATGRLAVWTLRNAPLSFVAFELIISLLILCCLPYGPLVVLSGALFEAKYGTGGVVVAGFALFCSTLGGEAACFYLARHKFKRIVEHQVVKNPNLSALKSLNRLIDEGQGVEMVMLLRLAPFPKGPANYFLGTTGVTVREFLIGSTIVNLPLCFIDVLIGAGAKHVNKNSPGAMAAFVVVVASFIGLLACVGLRAKRKLESFEAAESAGAFKAFDTIDAEANERSTESKSGESGEIPLEHKEGKPNPGTVNAAAAGQVE